MGVCEGILVGYGVVCDSGEGSGAVNVAESVKSRQTVGFCDGGRVRWSPVNCVGQDDRVALGMMGVVCGVGQGNKKVFV